MTFKNCFCQQIIKYLTLQSYIHLLKIKKLKFKNNNASKQINDIILSKFTSITLVICSI
jgi:hypothetical protein